MPASGMFDSLAGYPHWFVVACVVLAALGVVWLLAKVLKLAMWMLFVGILLVAAATVFGVFFR
jgi:hypothetical protein